GRTYAALAYCLALIGSPQGALSHIEEARGRGFENAELFNNRAWAALQLRTSANMTRLFADVRRDLERALELNPRLQAAFFNRGELLYSEWLQKPDPAKLADAISNIEAAISIGP